MKKVIMLSLLFMVTSNVFAIPTITMIAAQGATIKFIAVLSEKLPIGYKVKVDYSNGKGLVAMSCSSIYCTLSSNTLPTGVASAIYNIGIYNTKGVLQGAVTAGAYTIFSTPPLFSTSTTSDNVIESNVDGTFNGWDGSTIIKLSNGQTFQQSEYYYKYDYAYRPSVVVYKSYGTFKMWVTGIDKPVGVKQLK
jgi:hypothetical protein